jgi:uncharacterized protein YjbI with pentapeptide repeats
MGRVFIPSDAPDGGLPAERLAPGAALAGADLRGRDLRSVDLSGANLMGADLRDADLTDANLSDAELAGADLSGATLMHARCSRAGLLGATLVGIRAERVQLDDASLTGADLSGADLTGANLAGARLTEATLHRALLEHASLAGADLRRARLRGADLLGADLSRSRLDGLQAYTSASFVGVDLRDADFRGAYGFRRFAVDQNYLYELRHRSRASAVVYWLWWATSDCGRSLVRWSGWTVAVTLGFAWLYTLVDVDFGSHATWLSPLYYSVVTLTTLGYGDVLPTSTAAQAVAMGQALIGYIALGGLLSILTTKMGRRGE